MAVLKYEGRCLSCKCPMAPGTPIKWTTLSNGLWRPTHALEEQCAEAQLDRMLGIKPVPLKAPVMEVA